MMLRTKLSIVLALVVLAAAMPSFAQSAREQAGRLFSQGNTLYDKGDYAGALKKFEEARARYPSYKIDLNIATVLVDLGRTTEAAQTYEIFLQRGSALAPPKILASARTKLDDLRSRMGRVSVSAAVEGATLEVDGKPFGTLPRDQPVYLQPGEHRLQACKQGYRCGSQTVTVAAGEQRELALAMLADSPTDTAMTTAPPPTEGSNWKATAGWITLGVGGAAMITGVVFGTMVSSKSDEHTQAIDDGKTYGELQEIADAGQRYEKVQIAMLVMGGVALAAGGGLLLWHYLDARRDTPSRTAFVAPLLNTRVCGLVGGLRF